MQTRALLINSLCVLLLFCFQRRNFIYVFLVVRPSVRSRVRPLHLFCYNPWPVISVFSTPVFCVLAFLSCRQHLGLEHSLRVCLCVLCLCLCLCVCAF